MNYNHEYMEAKMMSTILFIVAFIAGICFEKIYKKIQKCSYSDHDRSYGRKKRVGIESMSICDILPLVDVYPYFKPQNICTEIHDEMYISPPKEFCRAIHTQFKKSKGDVLFHPLRFPGISEDKISKAIELARYEIANKFVERKDGLYYNGPKLGVLHADGFSRTADSSEDPILCIKFYRTDHYTSRVIQNAVTRLAPNPTSFTVGALNTDLNWIRTSISISIITVIRLTNEIIMTYRSRTAAYSNGMTWIYVSATETLTEADTDKERGKISIANCVARGLREELGITSEMYLENSVKIYDMFFETHFYRDGIIASVELNDRITFEDVKKLKAKDKQLEVDSIFVIKNDKKEIEHFIDKNINRLRPQTVFALKTYIEKNTEEEN